MSTTSTLDYRIPFFIWMAVILSVSSIPEPTLQKVGFSVKDYLAHGVEYSILGFLSLRLVRAEGKKLPWSWLLVVLVAFCMGAVDETYQRLIPGRTPSWSDFAADLVGSLAGAWIAIVYYALTARLRTPSGGTIETDRGVDS